MSHENAHTTPRDCRVQCVSSRLYCELLVKARRVKVPALTDKAASEWLGRRLQQLADFSGTREAPPADLTAGRATSTRGSCRAWSS